MKKRTLRTMAVLVFIVFAVTVWFSGSLTFKTISTSWKLSELTHESSYYQDSYITPESYSERDELVRDVEVRRDAIKNDSDKFVAWVANMSTFGKVGVAFAFLAMTACQVYLAAKVVMFMYDRRKGYARDTYNFMCTFAYIIKVIFTAIAKAIAWTLATIAQCIVVAVLFAIGKITGKQRVSVYTTKKSKKHNKRTVDNEMGTIVPFRRQA